MEENYILFGEAWRNDMQKLNKDTIITLYAEACKELHANAKICKCGKQECRGVVECSTHKKDKMKPEKIEQPTTNTNVIKNKKVIYFCDPMYTMNVESSEQEFNQDIKPTLTRNGLEFKRVFFVERPPFRETYDILFFDWGGMSIGNSLLESFCREIIKVASDRPTAYFVMASSFTKYAMEEAIEYFKGNENNNIFLTVCDFAIHYNKIEFGKE